MHRSLYGNCSYCPPSPQCGSVGGSGTWSGSAGGWSEGTLLWSLGVLGVCCDGESSSSVWMSPRPFLARRGWGLSLVTAVGRNSAEGCGREFCGKGTAGASGSSNSSAMVFSSVQSSVQEHQGGGGGWMDVRRKRLDVPRPSPSAYTLYLYRVPGRGWGSPL